LQNLAWRVLDCVPGHANWNSHADVNHDNLIDVLDLTTVAMDYGKVADYIIFSSGGQKVYLDSQGCARIPSGASGLTLYVNGVAAGSGWSVEFFDLELDSVVSTDNLGGLVESWTPTQEEDDYMMQVKSNSSVFDVFSSCISNTTVGLDASVNVFQYLDVFKRPIQITVTQDPDPPIYGWNGNMMIVSCYDSLLGQPAEGLTVHRYIYHHAVEPPEQPHYLEWGPSLLTNSSGMEYWVWDPYDVENHGSMDYIWRVVCDEGDFTQEAIFEPVEADYRDATCLEFLGDETINVDVGIPYPLTFNLTDTGDYYPEPLEGPVEVYVNDVLNRTLVTNATGLASMVWTPNQTGIFFFRAYFNPSLWSLEYSFKPSETRFVAVEGDSGRHYRAIGEGAGSNRQRAGEGGGSHEGQQIPNHLQSKGVRGCAGETLDQIDVGAGALLIVHSVGNVLELVESDLHVRLGCRSRYVAVGLRVVLGGRRRDTVGKD
jgi:hypothetical protein